MESSLSPHRPTQPEASALEDIGTYEILEGLARLHSQVLVCDMQGRILWMSDALGTACGGANHHVGRNLGEVFAAAVDTRFCHFSGSLFCQSSVTHHLKEDVKDERIGLLDLRFPSSEPLQQIVVAQVVVGARPPRRKGIQDAFDDMEAGEIARGVLVID